MVTFQQAFIVGVVLGVFLLSGIMLFRNIRKIRLLKSTDNARRGVYIRVTIFSILFLVAGALIATGLLGARSARRATVRAGILSGCLYRCDLDRLPRSVCAPYCDCFAARLDNGHPGGRLGDLAALAANGDAAAMDAFKGAAAACQEELHAK